MRFFIVLILAGFALAGKGNGNENGKSRRAQRKLTRKEFRKCKNENCSTECADKEYLNKKCYACLDNAECPLPKRKYLFLYKL